jgi:hypothetical protein
MSLPQRQQLEWVHRNRQSYSRTQTIGAVMAGLFDARFDEAIRRRAAVQSAIGHAVDDTFRELCTLGKVDDRRVEILVEHPTAAAALRRQWLFELVDHLDRQCRFRVSPQIEFRVGRGGDAFTSPAPENAAAGQEAPAC